MEELTPSQLIDNDAFVKMLGITVTERRPGYAKAVMPVTDTLKNGAGFVQGGAIFTLADYACAAAFNSGQQFGATITAAASFLANFREGTLYAEAHELSRGKRVAFYRVQVCNEKGEPAADFSMTCYYIK